MNVWWNTNSIIESFFKILTSKIDCAKVTNKNYAKYFTGFDSQRPLIFILRSKNLCLILIIRSCKQKKKEKKNLGHDYGHGKFLFE